MVEILFYIPSKLIISTSKFQNVLNIGEWSLLPKTLLPISPLSYPSAHLFAPLLECLIASLQIPSERVFPREGKEMGNASPMLPSCIPMPLYNIYVLLLSISSSPMPLMHHHMPLRNIPYVLLLSTLSPIPHIHLHDPLQHAPCILSCPVTCVL